jgi:hypothetical protein
MQILPRVDKPHSGFIEEDEQLKRGLGMGLLVIAGILLIWGFQTSNSISSNLHELFTGSPSDKAIWLIAIGAFCGVFGLVLLLLPGQKSRNY